MAKKNTSASALARRAWVAIKTRALSMFNHKHSDNRMYYGDHHQLSFDETPSFRFGFHLQKTSSRSLSSCFPCIKPVASFNSGLEQDEHGIDVKAEEFIAQFYEQMKLQRQASLSLAA